MWLVGCVGTLAMLWTGLAKSREATVWLRVPRCVALAECRVVEAVGQSGAVCDGAESLALELPWRRLAVARCCDNAAVDGRGRFRDVRGDAVDFVGRLNVAVGAACCSTGVVRGPVEGGAEVLASGVDGGEGFDEPCDHGGA
jgi:hypothetical protein